MISGHTVKVTFFLADPPAVSNFRVHCPELEHADFRLVSRVVFSEKHLLLLHFKFTYRPFIAAAADREPPPAQYFLYKAADHGGQPSLTPIPTTTRPDNNIASFPSVLPLEDDYGNFLVADLAITPTRGHYDLHIFSSKTNKWTARSLQLQASPAVPDDLPSRLPDKVIALGAGTIGWIDLWRGIIVCNVFEPDPVLRFIPLPKPEFNLRRRDSPQPVRDVTCCCDGFIKFVEMEHYPRLDSRIKRNFKKTTRDLDDTACGVLYDSELFLHSFEDLTKEPSSPPDAWKIRTMFRHTSWNLWCKGHATLHVDDILVNDPSYYMTLPELWDISAAKFTLRNLIASWPTLGVHGGDLVYLVLKVRVRDYEAWVVSVDLRKKTVEMLKPCNAGRPFLASTFSGYLNTTPRSCAPEDGYRYLSPGNIIQNNVQNMQIAGSWSRSSSEHGSDRHPVNSYQFQPQLVVPPHSLPQTLQHNFTPSGPGYVGQQWLFMPMDSRFQPHMLPVPTSLAVPTLMPRVPMDERFLSQMPPVPAYPAVPFNTLMPWVPMDARFLSQMPPVPAYPGVGSYKLCGHVKPFFKIL